MERPRHGRQRPLSLRAFLAADGVSVGDDAGAGDDVDDADVFVEVKTARFINALGLPAPDGLPV